MISARDHAAFTAAGIDWVRAPAIHDHGTVAVFADLYGNLWDLVQFAPGHPAARLLRRLPRITAPGLSYTPEI